MTAITIERELLEQALDALSAPNHRVFSESPICVGIRAALEAPATAPEFPADWAQMIHYPECWDTAAYPELHDAIHEALAWSGCSVCNPATAPAWHDAPTVPGLWFCDEGDENPYRFTCHNVSIPLNPHLVGEGERWFGPIPPDGDKP